MSTEIRIAVGDITAHELLNDDSSLVVNWPLQTEMTKSNSWRASQPDKGEMRRQMRPSLARGSGKWVGLWSGVIEFWSFNGAMREYVNETILQSKPMNTITAYLHSIEHDEFQVFVGELVSPHAQNSESEYQRFDDSNYYSNKYIFRRATLKTISVLATNSDFVILTRSGLAIALEQQE